MARKPPKPPKGLPAPQLVAYQPSLILMNPAPQRIVVTGLRLKAGLLASVGVASEVRETSFVWTVTFATAGIVSLTVRNPDGKISNALEVRVNAPIIVVPPTPTEPVTYGPRASITPPVGAVMFAAGSTSASRQTIINAQPNGTDFGFEAGVHTATSSNVPKTNQKFWGEYGAIIDGTTWTGASENDGAFLGNNNGVTGVCIRNLVIRNMPKKGIHNRENALHWTIEYNEIHNCQWGVVATGGIALRYNKIHHNFEGLGAGNYALFSTEQYSPGSTNWVEYNEISHGGDQQKSINSGPTIWRGNWCHDNIGSGIWNDGEGLNSLMEDNILEDNWIGIHWELSTVGIFRNNTIRRSGDAGIYISTSRDTEVYGNLLEDNFRGVTLYLTCAALPPAQTWPWLPDLKDNHVHDNVIKTGNVAGAIATIFGHDGGCGGAQPPIAPYLDNTKNNICTGNHYIVPNTTNRWYWVTSQSWAQWQALPQDATGSFEIG